MGWWRLPLLITGVLSFFFELSFAQSIHDLQKRLLQLPGKDTSYVNTLNQIGDNFITQGGFDSSFNYLNEAFILSQDLSFKSGEAQSSFLLAKVYFSISDNVKGMEKISHALTLYESLGNKKHIAACLLQSGLAFYGENDYGEALNYFNRTEKLSEEVPDKVKSATACYLAGLCLIELDSLSEAEARLVKAEKEWKESANMKAFYECRVGLAKLYIELRQFDRSGQYYEECLDYFTASGLMEGVSESKLGLGMLSLALKDSTRAKSYLLDAYTTSNGVNHTPVMIRSSQILISLFSEVGDYNNAFRFQSEFYKLRDSVYSVEKTRTIAKLQNQVEQQQNQAKNEKLSAELEINKIFLFLLLGGVLLLVLIAALFYQRYRLKQQSNQNLMKLNKDLNDALQQLKSAQVQLIHSEKMASLGQLTAGIAHELNNPINFVAGNVGPLRRDILELLEIIGQYNTVIEEKADPIV